MSEPKLGARESGRGTPGQPRVLLVAGDLEAGLAHARALRSSRLDVTAILKGEQALALLAEAPFDAVVCDAAPGTSGIDVLREVRECDWDLPVFLVTDSPSLEAATLAVELGASSYFTKPADVERLVEAVWRATDRYRSKPLRRPGDRNMGSARPRSNTWSLGDFNSTIWSTFQPILSTTSGALVGYEAFLRSSESPLKAPELLNRAQESGRLHELTRVVRNRIAAAVSGSWSGLVFVNVHPRELNDNHLFAHSSPLSAVASRVILEITERESLRDVSGLTTRLSKLRTMGYRLAIDNLDSGHCGLSSIARMDPEFVKLGPGLIRDVETSARTRTLVRAIARACRRDLGITVIATGVERGAQRDVLIQDGIELMQGHLFGRTVRRPSSSYPARPSL